MRAGHDDHRHILSVVSPPIMVWHPSILAKKVDELRVLVQFTITICLITPAHAESSYRTSTLRVTVSLALSLQPEAIPMTGRSTGRRKPDRQREELLAMRAEADQLTRRLERLRAQQQTPPVRAHETQNTEKSLLRAKIWKSVSDRQLERREEAEQENKRLREMLDEQNMVIKSLERLMRKQYRVDETMFASQIRRLELDPDTDGSEDEDLDGMLDDLLGMYAEVDLILADSRFRLATPYRDVCLRNDSMPVAAIESVDVRILPFACDRTANAIWSRIQEGSTPSSSASLGQDSMVRRVKGSVTYPRLDSAYQGWVAVHRFIDSTRIVITCQTLASVDVTAPTGKRGYISLRHKSWYILYPIELEDEGAQVPTPATRVQLYQMISPEGGGQGDGTLDDLIHLWTTAVLETVEDHVEARQRALENLLLATECQ